MAIEIQTERIYYVYALIDPRTSVPFYVGKGKGSRRYDHLKYNVGGVKKNKKIRELRSLGIEPLAILLYENLSEEEAFETEEDIIICFGREGIDPGGVLTNNRLRARGIVSTPEVIEARANKRRGSTASEATRKLQSIAKKGKSWEEIFGIDGAAHKREQNSVPKGPMPEERKRNIADAKRGKAPHEWSEESRQKLSATTTGRTKVLSDERRQEYCKRATVLIECPHCGKVGASLPMRRWHFDNCKNKKHDRDQ